MLFHVLRSGPPGQNWNLKQWISQAANDLKRAQVNIMYVQIGSAKNQDLYEIANSGSLVFTDSDIEGLSGALLDASAEICSNGKSGNIVDC